MVEMRKHEDIIIELTDVVDDEELQIADVPPEPVPDEVPLPRKMPDDAVTVSEDQVIAAVEKVVREQFSQKIEAMMDTVMEKVLIRELSEMKERLLSEMERVRKV